MLAEGKINVSDPDSREMRTQGQPNIQGYNAQAVVTEQQIVIAAEITTQSPDFGQLEPMVSAAVRELEQAGVSERPRTVLADAAPFNGPVVIAGDFNSYGIGVFLERHGYRWLTRDIDPTISIFTWDHIFVRRLAPAGRAGVVHETRGASDHRPVWAVVVPEATGRAGLAKAAGTR